MRLPHFAVTPALLLGILCSAVPDARGGFSFFRNTWGDVIVATDTTAEGHELTPPTPDKPVYYLGQSLGCKLGSLPGDDLPSEKDVNLIVTKILAKQGYVGATRGVHEPTLYMVVQWGSLRPGSGDLMWFMGYRAQDDIGSPIFPGVLGPEVFLRNFRSRTVQTILDNANGDMYGIIVTAFEYKSASTPKPTIYWQTRIGLPANGKSMTQALPTMLVAAGNSIGRESKSPVLANADTARGGDVRLGELRILDVINDPPHSPDSPSKR